MFCLTCIQVKIFLYHRHLCIVSPPSRSHITFIHYTKCTSRVHPCLVSTPSKFPRFAPHLHPGQVSLPPISCITSIQVPMIASHLLNSPIILPSRSWGMCLTCIHAPSHLHPGPWKIFYFGCNKHIFVDLVFWYAMANDIFATVFYSCYFLLDSVMNTSLEKGSRGVVGKK